MWTTAGLVAMFVPTAWAGQRDDRIARVESGLTPPVVVKGQPKPSGSLLDRMKHYHVPGVSVAVIDDFNVHWAKGYGALEVGKSDPVTSETVFQAASVSKPVSVMSALHLVDKGLLELDEDVNRKLKSWKVPENEFTAKEKVTLRRLASHSAGTTVPGFEGYRRGQSLPTLVQILDGRPPANSPPVRVDVVPGTISRYSGGGTLIVQQLLEDVVGEPFPKIMDRVVLEPIGMTNSTFEYLTGEAVLQAAKGHDFEGARRPGGFRVYAELAAASLWTTPTDLAEFAIEIMRARRGESNRVLSAASAREMLTVQKEPFGLGFAVVGEEDAPEFTHGGANTGYKCELIALPEQGQGAVVMTNGDHGLNLIREIIGGIAVVYDWPSNKPEEKVAINVNPARLRAYVGRYSLPVGTQLVISRGTRGLMFQLHDYPPEPMYATSENTFFVLSQNFEMKFVLNGSDKASSILLSAPGISMQADRVD
jgi:CubicO group peptidase (beta-lactamase class C family)